MPWTTSDGKTYTGDAWPLPDDATSHPRSAGCFTRFIREWVRERRTVSLLEGIRKCALIPAEILSQSTPAMRAKGRLQADADADIVVFDYETLTRPRDVHGDEPPVGRRAASHRQRPAADHRWRDGCRGAAGQAGAPARRRELIMPVPILLVTGFLGAGKTTVVNHLLAHAEGRRIAAVVNDFGAINIDAELIAGASDGVVSLANGCICCSLEGDLLRTLVDAAAARSAARIHRHRNQRHRRSRRHRPQPDGSRDLAGGAAGNGAVRDRRDDAGGKA